MHSIGFVLPYVKLADITNNIMNLLDEPIDVRVGDMNEAVPIANKMLSEGIEVIVSRGGTALLLREFVDIPIIEIQITPIDIMKSIKKAKDKGNKIGFLGYDNLVQNVKYNIQSIAELLDVEILPVIFTKNDTIEQKMDKIKTIIGQVDIVVGDHVSVQIARQCGIESILIESGEDAIFESFMHAKSVRDATNKERQKFEELKTILDYTDNGILSINHDGKIKYFNPVAEKIFDAERNLAIGKNIDNVFSHIDFSKVIAEGDVITEKFYNVGHRTIIMNVIPIKLRNRIASAISVFQDITKIQSVEEKIRKQVYLKGHVARYKLEDMITGSEKMHQLVEMAKLYANTHSNVLILGETGTGKEFFAQGIHNASARKNKPFVALNCAALPDSLLESELFGYEEGAFTGARKGGKQGLFELAHGGTIFLDEIGEIVPHIQTRLLRVLQEKQVMRLGSDKVIPVDVRIIAATNKDLKHGVEANSFREDLYYRLSVLTMKIPPLRQRKEAIPLFVESFIDKYCKQNNREKKDISDSAMKALQLFEWGGNVRELENIIERLVIIVPSKQIELHHIEDFIDGWNKNDNWHKNIQKIMDKDSSDIDGKDPFYMHINANKSLKEIEKEIINKVLDITDGDRKKTAGILGIGKTTLWRWMKDMDDIP